MQKSNSLFVTVDVLVIIISRSLTMASAQNKQAPGSTQNIAPFVFTICNRRRYR